MAVLIQIGEAIKEAGLEIRREPRHGGTRERHITVCVSEWPALVFRRMSFAKHMPWIWRWDDLHIRQTRRPIVVDPAIEAAPLTLSPLSRRPGIGTIMGTMDSGWSRLGKAHCASEAMSARTGPSPPAAAAVSRGEGRESPLRNGVGLLSNA